jgi:DNA-binding MarR family transcriptional regulator
MDHIPLVRLLSMAVTSGLDDLHAELARRGHATLRPVHGYALNAVDGGCATASELGPRLGMTKQGAAKVLQHLVDEGYVAQDAGSEDARRKPHRLTARGRRVVALSIEVQDRIERQWTEVAGARRSAAMREALERVVSTHVSADGELPPVRPAW